MRRHTISAISSPSKKGHGDVLHEKYIKSESRQCAEKKRAAKCRKKKNRERESSTQQLRLRQCNQWYIVPPENDFSYPTSIFLLSFVRLHFSRFPHAALAMRADVIVAAPQLPDGTFHASSRLTKFLSHFFFLYFGSFSSSPCCMF